MQVFFNEILAQLKGIWNRLDAGQRLVVSAVMVATLAGLGAVVWFASQPSYETVFTARTPEEIAQFQEAMQKAGISWRVANDGRTFQVERANVGRAYMASREAGVHGGTAPNIGGGASLIEDAETKAWRLDGATRAQAASAIAQIDGVVGVTVTGSRPRRGAAFQDRDRETRASATVVLRLKPGLAFDVIARNAALVAGAQLQVPLENIDVVSATSGQRWRYDADRDAGGGSSEFLNLQRTMSEERTQRAQERLDQLWPGKTSVSVNIELDPSWEVRSEKVVPDKDLVRSEKVSKDNTVTPGKTDAEGKSGSSKNETKDREFVTEIGERRTGRMAPEIKRMTVALLYDRSLEANAQSGFSKDDLVKAVKAIVGWNPDRDKADAFSTLASDFAKIEDLEVMSDGPGFADVALKWGPTVGQMLGVLVVVLFLRGLFKRAKKSTPSDRGMLSAEFVKAETEEKNLTPEEQQKRMRREIERSIATDPAALAKLLEAWLMETKA